MLPIINKNKQIINGRRFPIRLFFRSFLIGNPRVRVGHAQIFFDEIGIREEIRKRQLRDLIVILENSA